MLCCDAAGSRRVRAFDGAGTYCRLTGSDVNLAMYGQCGPTRINTVCVLRLLVRMNAVCVSSGTRTFDYDRWATSTLLYIPKGHRLSLMRVFHDEHEHINVEKTLDLILKHFWFPGLRQFVSKYIAHCLL